MGPNDKRYCVPMHISDLHPSASKRILIATSEFAPFFGGVATYCERMASEAAVAGHDVTILAPSYYAHSGPSTGVPEVVHYPGKTYDATQFITLLRYLWRVVSRKPFDLIHAADWPMIMALAFINRFRKVPFVATVYGSDIMGARHSRQMKLLGVSNPYQYAKGIYAISEYTNSLLQLHFPGIPSQIVKVTPLGVDKFWFGVPSDGRAVRQKYGVPAEHTVILTVARLDERKGHRTVFKSLSALPRNAKRQLSYVIVGTTVDAKYRHELTALAETCGVHTVFTGAVSDDELLALYGDADIFCMPGEPHPQKVEGFGLVYLEAAAQAVPSIASSVGAIPEVVRDGETGILIPPLDTHALTESLLRLLDEPGERRRLGQNARRTAVSFSWARCAASTYGGPSGYQDDQME
jgi:phosphatidylinositol alpha-1,6-mannosyltransferase